MHHVPRTLTQYREGVENPKEVSDLGEKTNFFSLSAAQTKLAEALKPT